MSPHWTWTMPLVSLLFALIARTSLFIAIIKGTVFDLFILFDDCLPLLKISRKAVTMSIWAHC